MQIEIFPEDVEICDKDYVRLNISDAFRFWVAFLNNLGKQTQIR